MSISPRAIPHADRLHVFETLVTLGIMLVLVFCLSVYVISLPVKAMLMLTTVCLFLNREKTVSPAVWPLLAIPLYGAAVSWAFPGWKPDLWTILERPLFTVLCVLMVSVVLSQTEAWRHRVLAFAILLVCVIGAMGDILGYDMTAALPFTMPDDAFFEQVTMDKFGAARVRGFFPESGVLGAVSLGIATSTALGAWVLITQKRHPGAWGVLCAAIAIGGVMLALTLTKSGLFMAGGGMAGLLILIALGRNMACRTTALVGCIMAAVVLGGLLSAPGSLGDYFRTEVGNALTLQEQTGQGGGGLATRVECWKLALYSVEYYPGGVGGWGVDTVLNRTTEVVPTTEMRFFFDRDMFGLKSALANMISQTGLVGILLLGFWLWGSFLAPAVRLLQSRNRTETMLAGLYGASAALSLVFLFCCELYPSFALLLFFKLHADAIADHVIVPQREVVEQHAENLLLPEGVTI